jgi:hypothetical protein
MSHHAEQINIICTDPRIQKLYHDWLVKNDLFGKFDTIQFENPILAFLNPTTQKAMLERIGNYIKLHNPKKVVLIDHTDCGAYKLNKYHFNDLQDELIVHAKNNLRVSDLIRKHYPQLEIEIKIIYIRSDGECTWYTGSRNEPIINNL